ncbi:hypothetical protein GIB67_006513 [Kingdonia uniflora]|uniref:F-box domain-containing protein n=1 Tax=Kingdonia uniflora TaxID=39325 RepID=A0A7J7LES5_9MAGN|nr:hypothetical protein GIB67_006513 [Kingdonia uniflora]
MGEREFDFSVLPDGCVSYILSLTTPRDVCRSSVVSSMFKFAADSNIVWEKFLPSDYKEIVSGSVLAEDFESKKELFFYLCEHPVIVDGGKMSFALDKSSGKKSYMLGARELTIIWGDTPQYWRWKNMLESRFEEVAELHNVCWLEISGKMDIHKLSPKTTYAAYFVLKLGEGAHGLDHPPAEVSIKFPGVGGSDGSGVRAVYLDPEYNQRRRHTQVAPHHRVGLLRRRFSHMLGPDLSGSRWEGQIPKDRGDGWLEIDMGEFFNDNGKEGEVQMTLTEVKGGHWKAGLIVQGIELRPKEITATATATATA